MLNHKVTSKRRKSRNPLIESLFGQSQVKTNTNSLSQPLFNPIPRLLPTVTKAIENQSKISLRSSAGGPKIGVATGIKNEGRFKHFPPSKVKKNEN
jgi:hypothetical protein